MSSDIKFTLLSKDQVFGNSKLEILQNCGSECAVTDLAILQGAVMITGQYKSQFNNIRKKNTLSERTGEYWTKSKGENDYAATVKEDGKEGYCQCGIRTRCIRLATEKLSDETYSNISKNKVMGYNGVYEVEYGEYPQMAPDNSIQKELETAYINNNYQITRKIYTFDSRPFYLDDLVSSSYWFKYNYSLEPIEYDEMIINDKKYIRLSAMNMMYGNKLSNGEIPNNFDSIFLEVKPVVWLLDEKEKIMVSKKALASGIPFNYNDNYDRDYELTLMNSYIQNYLSKDLIPSAVITKNENFVYTNDEEIKRNK